MAVFQSLVRVLDGKTANLRFSSSTVSGKSLMEHLYEVTHIPPHHQRLVTGTQQLYEETLIEASGDGFFPTIHLLLRLPGGKGGFGSLLRGAATKAGQKKTNNFDACRDMSGRRLRHVNAEKKLEEWKAEAEERKLEKIAEDFIKKKAKEVKKSGSGDSDKYIEKYREDSSKCMEEVEASVRESFLLYENSKRTIMPASGRASKRLKMLMKEGKGDDSDSDDEDESSDDENEDKSVVLDDGNHPLENKDGEGCSTSFSGGQSSDGESSGGGSSRSNLEEENGLTHQGGLESEEVSGDGTTDANVNCSSEINSDEDSTSEAREASETEIGHSKDDSLPQPESISTLLEGQDSDSVPIHTEEKGSAELKSGAPEPMVVVPSEDNADLAKPLNFDEYNSAVDMEVLGLERLKAELQAHGLKCGGTLRERAARLFLVKTTPVEMLPKKLLAKK